MKRYINSLGTEKNCHKNEKNPLLIQFIKKAIKWIVIIIEQFHFCQLHIKFSHHKELSFSILPVFVIDLFVLKNVKHRNPKTECVTNAEDQKRR
jgi:hypothetical protein